MFDVFIRVYVLCTHKPLLMLVTCLNNLAAFVRVDGLVIVVALAFVYCQLKYCIFKNNVIINCIVYDPIHFK